MMRSAQLLAAVIYCLVCIYSLPVPEVKNSHRYKTADWPPKTHYQGLKKRGRLHHDQDTLNEDFNNKKVKPHLSLPKNGSDWNRPRCGVPDYPSQKKGSSFHYSTHKEALLGGRHRQKRFVLFGGRWDKTDLTYRIMRTPWQMSLEKVRDVLNEALRAWSNVTPLTFTEVTSGRADITIDFNRYWHGDNLPFDGPGGILAHAFFPRTYREGDIHFDYDESWTIRNNMGLQHSLEPGAVMSPFYSFSYPLLLSVDDKRGIQSLYGAKQMEEKVEKNEIPPEAPETNEIEITMPDACQTDFDAVSMIRGELFFFKSGYVWRIREGKLQAGYPALASRHWRGIPDKIDAAFEDRSGNIWFFQGQSYWVFDAERQITGPDSVHRLGLSVKDIQAALMWGEDKTQKIYFFKSGNYWRFNLLENRIDTTHARSMRDWRGIPNDIDAAFQDRYGFAHFLRGNQYWKFDPVEVNVLEGYPRYTGMDFFDCSPALY
ncbi:Stromelysin-3 [Triplophysa tibetana]|uniref:Stromelysin-3 n=1 Tax=Triplophysa tibetana TaxID=1572043 RepID=A0A5A9PD05_9TELE|nr:Stromelysin-3 [Triplophysa tibetana]